MCSRWAKWAAALAILLMVATVPVSCELLMFRGAPMDCHREMRSIASGPEHACCPHGTMPCCVESSPTSAPVPFQSPTRQSLSPSLVVAQDLVPIFVPQAIALSISAEPGVPPVLTQKEDFRT
jgi:hypothetical protein